MILTFYKSGKKVKPVTNKSFDLDESLVNIFAGCQSGKLHSEYIFNRLVIEAWQKSAIDSLSMAPDELVEHIESHGWHYDERNHFWAREQFADLPLMSKGQI